VSNAVKFTREGRVRVTARQQHDEEGGGWVEVRVADTGVGIPPEELSRVFDRFYRGDAARGRPGGTGLGLAIARLLVEQHGGRIDAQSRLGHGSEFRVLLPAAEEGVARGGAALIGAAGSRRAREE
jgi:signal transduction histidine kinase